MAEHFQQGNIIRLVCHSTKQSLRIVNGRVDGQGGLGEYARFVVQVRPSGTYVLQNYKEPSNHLAIYQGQLIGTGQGGPFCEFRIHSSSLGNAMVCLESVQCPSQFVGIMPGGQPKPPANTKCGSHGSFSVELVQSATPGPPSYGSGYPMGVAPPQPYQPPQPAYQPQPTYPQQPIYPEQPAYPPQTTYPQQPAYPPQPTYPEQPAYPPQTTYPQQPAYPPQPSCPPPPTYPQQPAYPQQPQYQPPPKPQAQPYGGYVAPTHPSNPPAKAPPSSPMDLFKHGYMIRLRCASTGRYLRITQNGSGVNGDGGEGELTKFIVVTRGPGVVSLQWVKDPLNYIGIYDNCVRVGPGHLQCAYRIHKSAHSPHEVSFECVHTPGQFLGILQSGEPKAPAHTKKGVHGSFAPVFIQEVNMHPNIGLRSNAYWRLAHGNVVFLTSRVNNKNLRMHPNGAVDCRGGQGALAKWIVENRGNGIITLRSHNDQTKYLNMSDTSLGWGSGGKLCAFRVQDPNDNMSEYICFSLASKPHLHVGALHNGDIKSPNATGNGAHAQFLVTVSDSIKY